VTFSGESKHTLTPPTYFQGVMTPTPGPTPLHISTYIEERKITNTISHTVQTISQSVHNIYKTQ